MHEFKRTIQSQSFQNGVKTVAAFIVVGLLGASITTAFPRPYTKSYTKDPATLSPVVAASNQAATHNNPTNLAPQSPASPTTTLQPPSTPANKVINNLLTKKTIIPPIAHAIQPIQIPNLPTLPPLNNITSIINPLNPVTIPPASIIIDPAQTTLPTATIVIDPPSSSPQYTNWRNLMSYIIDHPDAHLTAEEIVKLLQN